MHRSHSSAYNPRVREPKKNEPFMLPLLHFRRTFPPTHSQQFRHLLIPEPILHHVSQERSKEPRELGSDRYEEEGGLLRVSEEVRQEWIICEEELVVSALEQSGRVGGEADSRLQRSMLRRSPSHQELFDEINEGIRFRSS